jgi:hypothetical protein
MNLSSIIAARHRATAGFSTEAQNYFDRLDTAGDTTYTAYKQPLANYIDGLVTLGGAYWDNLESAASFVGVGIEGVTVPLKSTMPTLTNNNFVAGDLNQVTGLKADGSTKYIDTGTKFNDCPQNDFSMSVNVTETLLESNSGNYLAYQSFVDGVSQIASSNDSGVSNNDLVIRCQTRNANIISDQGSVEDFTGVSRELSTEYLVQYGASSTTITRASQAPANQIISLFGSPAVSKTNARFATFHIGRSLDMPTLRGLQNTLITEIAAVAAAVEIAAFAAESGATDLTGLTNLVVYLKQENLYDNFVIYPMKSAQNAGSGSTVYSLGGLTTVDLTIVAGAPWTSAGIDLNGTNQWMTSTVSGSNAWTELSFGARVIPDDASVTNTPTQAYVGQGTNDTPRFTYLGNGTGSLNGERLAIGMQNASVANRKGNTTFTWTAAEDFVFSGNMKTVTMSANGTTIPNNLTAGPATDYTPSQSGGVSNLIYHGALHYSSGGASNWFKGVMAASYLCNASITDTQRHAIDGYLAAL